LDLAKLADVTDSLALERAKVGCNSGFLEVDDAREGFVEKAADGKDREVASLGLCCAWGQNDDV
jgi:hypothetical protein